ncbi:MAG TPA: FHA domain-containing protein [Verrucomicrobiae bacterium]|nr:FHA domain-containing protein [Verrucomicrobiae bacterium]
MVQFKILSGKQAGATWVARRFPVQVGRGSQNGLRLEEDGVWEKHFVLDCDAAEGFILRTEAQALVRVNGQAVERLSLRNGDLVQLGSASLQFWLGDTRQRALGLREAVSWASICLVTLAQIALLYWLLQ